MEVLIRPSWSLSVAAPVRQKRQLSKHSRWGELGPSENRGTGKVKDSRRCLSDLGEDWFSDQTGWARPPGKGMWTDVEPGDVQGSQSVGRGHQGQPEREVAARSSPCWSPKHIVPFEIHHPSIFEQYFLCDCIILRPILKLFVPSERMLQGGREDILGVCLWGGPDALPGQLKAVPRRGSCSSRRESLRWSSTGTGGWMSPVARLACTLTTGLSNV